MIEVGSLLFWPAVASFASFMAFLAVCVFIVLRTGSTEVSETLASLYAVSAGWLGDPNRTRGTARCAPLNGISVASG